MQPTQELIDQLYREEVLRARQMSAGEKLLAGPELFDFACKVCESGIRNQNPDADERRVRELLHARIELLRRMEKCK